MATKPKVVVWSSNLPRFPLSVKKGSFGSLPFMDLGPWLSWESVALARRMSGVRVPQAPKRRVGLQCKLVACIEGMCGGHDCPNPIPDFPFPLWVGTT